jgi:succinyl-CoA synthetase beta subunit
LNLHEFQAKEVFRSFGIPVPEGRVVTSPDEALEAARGFRGPVVVKAQVHTGGRGKAGGVKLAADPDEARRKAGDILGMNIKGYVVRKLLVAPAADIAREIYLGIVMDRSQGQPVIMASASGGIDIEEVARTRPEAIVKHHLDRKGSFRAWQARQVAFQVEKDPRVALQMASILQKLVQLYWDCDCSLAEINPLVVTPEGKVMAIDAKMVLDDNGLYRHPELEAYRDEETDHERLAREKGLSFVKLEGSIGCIVNGAGLAMATMDLIKHFGAEPANFLDIGGSSNPEKVTAAMRIITADPQVRAIMFNIFGGITRCDDVARGIVEALEKSPVNVPLVVRLTGTNEEEGREILKKAAGLIPARTMDEAATLVIQAAGRGARS